MARKKQAKTPEQRLGEALVPCEEQPYAVPDNWCWVRASAVLKPMETANPRGKSFDYIDIDAIDNKVQAIREVKTLPVEKAPSRAKRKVHDGDTLFSMVRPYLRNIAYVDSSHDDCIASTGFYVCSPNAAIDRRYLYHLLCSNYTVNGLTSFMKGDNSPSIKKGDFDSFPLPLPPLAEQRRIVERVEGLFAKLDEAENKIHDALDSARHWRISLLHSAFSGQLARDWQGDRDLSDATWEARRFDEVAEIKQRLVDPADYPNLPHIAPDNIEKETGRLLQYRTVSEDGVISGKHRFYPGQIVYSKIRPYLSKVIIADFEGLCSADMYPIEAKIDTHYLWLYMLSQDFLAQTYDAGSRTVLPKINMKSLSAIRVPTPSIEEQKVIVDILMAALSRRNEAELLLNQALQRIGKMRSVVLAKALRGRLGTNETGDPSAQKELLAMFQSKVTRNKLCQLSDSDSRKAREFA